MIATVGSRCYVAADQTSKVDGYMNNVRTTVPQPNTSPTIGINILKVIEDNVPVRLREIEGEVNRLNTQLEALSVEAAKLTKLLVIVQD